jgi:hypothetical protein
MHKAVQNSVVEDLNNVDVLWYNIMENGTRQIIDKILR